MKKFRLGTKGFTLVELMATVAIVGVLAAVAIPNYIKYQRKARQAEAKAALASAYLGESTLMGAENGKTYSSCIGALGISPEGVNVYGLGFTNAAATATTCGPNGLSTVGCNAYSYRSNTAGAYTSTAACTTSTVGDTNYLAKRSEPGPGPATQANFGGVLTWNTFDIVAAGAIGGSNLDRWGVDQNKQIYQAADGVK